MADHGRAHLVQLSFDFDRSDCRSQAVQLYQNGCSIKRIMRETGLRSTVELYRSLRETDVSLRRSFVSEEIVAEVMASYDQGCRAIGRRLGVSKSTVHRIRQRVYRAEDQELYDAGELEPAKFQTLNTSKRCPVHGAVNVWPCVACEASKNRQYH